MRGDARVPEHIDELTVNDGHGVIKTSSYFALP